MMDVHPEDAGQAPPTRASSAAAAVVLPRRSPSARRRPAAFRVCEWTTEGLIYFILLFNPWVFGSTQTWAIWVMNAAGYALGGILLAQWAIARSTGYQPARWDLESSEQESPLSPRECRARWLAGILMALNGLILLYCLVSAINARATFVLEERRQIFHDASIAWLPHSYDSRATWFAFWEYLGLSLAFWSLRAWLLGKSHRERHTASETDEASNFRVDNEARQGRSKLPDRLKRLLWVLCVNGAILGVEGILQRYSGTNQLLWLVEPSINREPLGQFGPYAYRSNAAQYFNLIWPASLGFWWVLRREHHQRRQSARVGGSAHILLLPLTVIMAAAPILTASRGGAIIAMGQMLGAMLLLWLGGRQARGRSRWMVAAVFLGALSLVTYLGWAPLAHRFKTIFQEEKGDRAEIYQNARTMLRDYPVFGSGPGTFGSIYQFYRQDVTQDWMVQAHNDWLETRITFGWVGFVMILAALGVVLLYWPLGAAGFPVSGMLVALFGLALGGCLLHARFDFPLQIHSILTLFLFHSAVLFSAYRRS